MIDDAFDGDFLAKETTYVGCFVAGTLVHTDKGLVPIQNIQVGDMVLSSPEEGNGSIREYKRVISTFKAESEEIYELVIRKRIYPEDEDDICHDIYEMIYLTGGHPIYVENSVFIEGWDSESDIDQINARSDSWQAARDLKIYDQMIVSNPKHGDGSGYKVVSIAPVQDVGRDYGFISAATVDDNKPFDTVVYLNNDDYYVVGGDIEDDHSANILIDYFIGSYRHTDYPNDYPFYKDFQENYEKITASVRGYIADIPTLRRPVYNFEVEDYHTYFVGEQGLWVHNNGKCSGHELVPANKLIQDTEFKLRGDSPDKDHVIAAAKYDAAGKQRLLNLIAELKSQGLVSHKVDDNRLSLGDNFAQKIPNPENEPYRVCRRPLFLR